MKTLIGYAFTIMFATSLACFWAFWGMIVSTGSYWWLLAVMASSVAAFIIYPYWLKAMRQEVLKTQENDQYPVSFKRIELGVFTECKFKALDAAVKSANDMAKEDNGVAYSREGDNACIYYRKTVDLFTLGQLFNIHYTSWKALDYLTG